MDNYRDLYAATFGATFARLVADHKAVSDDPVDYWTARNYAEEAETVAHLAVEALDAYLREKIENAKARRGEE